MLRKFKLILVFLVACNLFTSFQTAKVTGNDPKDKVLLTILNHILTKGHYQPKDIDDNLSAKVYEAFINRLDPSKRYFLQTDIDEFSKYKFAIDDQIKSEDLSFFFLAYNRFVQRFEESKVYCNDILAKPFSFDINETLDIEYDQKPYATNNKELYDIWRKQLKLSTLSRVYDKITEAEDKLETDSSYAKQPLEKMEISSREAVKENMDEFYMRFEELTYSDWFSTFINCITEQFDPHTTYFDPAFKKRFDQSMSGKLEGIGARLQKQNEYTKVVELISGGPAWKQGELEVGDIIIKVAQGDGEPLDIVGMRLDDAIEFIKGKKGTEARLTVKKIDGTIKIISIIRDVVELEETFVKSSIVEKDGKSFAIIDLPKFYIDFDEKNYRNATTDMKLEIARLKSQNVEGIILDLRNNGGGSLKTAIEISGLFINKGPIVQVKYRDSEAQVKKDTAANIEWDGPFVVLVNELSASASEIFAAAMQDYKRAVIIGGKQTYGKGTVQHVIDLNRYTDLNDDIGALKMTIQKFYRINGGSNQLQGVQSDIMLPSRYSYLDIGERDLDNALKFDNVPASNYTEWNNYSNFQTVVNNSKKRIGKNETFKLIDENAKSLKKSQDDTIVYLNLEAYKKDVENHEKDIEKFKPIGSYESNLTYASPNYEQKLVKGDEDLLAKREAWHKNLKKDIYVEEALNVLSELKIKPEYLLVKN